jgi:sugar phosphate isomerase/epimerase
MQSFPWETWPAEFDRAQALGYDTIEWLFDAENHTANPLWSASGLADIRANSARTGVAVLTVCANYCFWHPFYRVPEGERRASEAVLLTVVERAAALGVRTVLVPTLERAGLHTPDERAQLAESLRAPLDRAAGLGVTLALETDLPAAEAVEVCAGIDHPALGLYYDSGNAAALGYDPAAELAVVTPWLRGVHIKDRLLGGPNVPLGTGAVDFPGFFAALAAIPYQGPLVLETTPGDNYAEAAERHLRFVRAQLAAAPHILTR